MYKIIKIKKMLTIKYKNHTRELDTWQQELEALVMAHELIEDETVEEPILTNTSETVIGVEAISKYMKELSEFQAAWFACNCG